MNSSNRNSFSFGLIAVAGLTVVTAVLMGQGASTPVKSDTQYFVTGDANVAHLWVREGAKLRCVGHGACALDVHSEHDHEGHDHGKDSKKP